MELISLASKGASFPTPGGGFYSPLSTALFFVFLHAGSHGLSVCEALKNLVKQGYSKLLNSNVHTRALQVKAVLRSCPAFKEIEGKRFALRFNRQNQHRISPIRLCKSKKLCGKKLRKIDKDFIMGDRQTTAIERDLCNQARVVGSCNQERSLHINPLTTFEKVPRFGSCDSPTANNVCTQSLQGMEGCCPLDQKHWRCIQHTTLGSLYSDRVNETGREDIKESAFILQGKDPVNVSCRSKDAHQEDKIQLGRCRRTDGKRWRCAKQVQLGSIYCEHHHIMRKGGYKAKVVDVVRAGATPPSIRLPEALSDKCVIKEDEGICFEPLKLANASLYVSTAQGVSSSWEISAKEELHEAQEEETKLFLHTLDSHNFEDVRRSKIKVKLAGLGQSVMVEATLHEGQKERTPDSHVLEEESHEGKEKTKQYLHRLGLHDIEDVETLKKEVNLTGHGRSVSVERTIHEGQQKTKSERHTLEKDVLEVQKKKELYVCTVEVQDQLGSICSENYHLTRKRGTMVGADVGSQLQSSVIPFKALLDKDAGKGIKDILVEPSMLATGSVAQEVVSSYKISVKEEFHEVHKEARSCLPKLELYDLEGVQRSKKKPKLARHGPSVMLNKHEGQEETKQDQHTLEKVTYERKQETTPKLHVLEIHDLEDAGRLNEAPKLAGHGEMIMLQTTVHEHKETAKLDLHVPASDGLDYLQRSQEDSMSKGQRSSMMPELEKEVSYNSFEDGTEIYKAKDLQIELSNPKEKQVVSKMTWLFPENPNKRLVELGNSSSSGQTSLLDRSLHVPNECASPRVCIDAPRQCHRKDGKGWQCSRQCKTGYIYCEHHHGRLSRTSTNGKKKMILQLELDKQVLSTCLKGDSETQVLRVAIDVPQTLVKGLKTKVTHCTSVVGKADARHEGQAFGASSMAKSTSRHIEEKRNVAGPRDARYEGQTIPTMRFANFSGRPPEGTTAAKDKDSSQLGRCHRKDGKGWQCAQQSMHGSIYCDRHQRQRSKSRFPCGSQHTRVFSRGPDFQDIEHVSDRCTYMEQPSHFALHISKSGLEHALDPKLQGQEIETRSRKQDDLGLASFSLATPVRALNGSCLWETNITSEQTVSLEKCHRSDGKKWQCSRLCMPGYNHCEYHQGRGRKVKFKT